MRMTILLGLVSLIMGAMAALVPHFIDRHFYSLSPLIVHEDSFLWDCETMGNRMCGPVTK